LRRRGLARGRALVTSAACLGALALAGCGPAGTSSTTVSGGTLTIYAAAPPSGQADARAQDVLDAEQLAIKQGAPTAGNYKLRFIVLHGPKISDNARTAIEDSTTIAYVGEIIPGESADSVGIVGDQGILQVSPTDTALELTEATPAVPGAPGIYYEVSGSGQHSFARVVPTTALEAKALVAEAASLNASKLYVADDGQPYGAALAYAVQHAGSAVAIVHGAPTAAAFARSGADALLYATADKAAAAALFDAVAQSNPSVHLLAPSALDDEGFAQRLSPAAQRTLEVSSPGFLPADLTPSGRQFEATFASTYGHQPSPQAIFGYEAVSALLSVLHRAGSSAGSRSTVMHDFYAIHNRASVLGTYSIDSNGDTNLGPFVISRMKGGRLTPYRFVSEQG